MFSGELHEKEIYLIVVSLHIAGNLHAHKSLLSDGFSISELTEIHGVISPGVPGKKCVPASQFSHKRNV